MDVGSGSGELVERELVVRVPAFADHLHVPTSRVADLGPELVDREVDDRVATLAEVGDHLSTDAVLDQADVVREADLWPVLNGDVLADEDARDVADLLDVAGHGDSSEVVCWADPARFFRTPDPVCTYGMLLGVSLTYSPARIAVLPRHGYSLLRSQSWVD